MRAAVVYMVHSGKITSVWVEEHGTSTQYKYMADGDPESEVFHGDLLKTLRRNISSHNGVRLVDADDLYELIKSLGKPVDTLSHLPDAR